MATARVVTVIVVGVLGLAGCASHTGAPKDSRTGTEDADEATDSRSADGESSPGEDPTRIVDDPETSSGASTKGPLEFTPLRGPLESLDAYRKERSAEWDKSCGAPPPRSKHPSIRAGGRGKIRSVELLRIPSQVSCDAVEYCALAFRTDEGWFVREDNSPCRQLSGSSRIQTKDERLVWADVGALHVLEYRYALVATQKSEQTEKESDTPLEGPTTHESENMAETKWLVLCGAGDSGKPSCTGRLVTSCAAANAEVHTVTWKYQDTTLTLDSTSDPNACRGDVSVVLGSHVLEIP